MQLATSYRSYPLEVKNEIARTRNIYLFPNLKIPRTTAQYWATKCPSANSLKLSEIENLYASRAKYLESELEKERALRRLLETVRKIFPYDFSERNVKSKTARSQIISSIKECQKHHPIGSCLNSIGLSKSRYQRWNSEFSFCKKKGRECGRRAPSQLTAKEINSMKLMVISKKSAHMSISSLHLFAQRKSMLFCSIDTWYKYVRYFEWERPWKVDRKKIRKTGIRATSPNQLWHIDVTVVNIRPGYKLYIQAVIDNFSRYVLAWRVTEAINGGSTIETINLARKAAAKLPLESHEAQIMMDPGTENNNKVVTSFISSQNILRILARVEVHYSNSMIECLFRGLKNNYLYHQGIRTIEDLTRKATYYFNQHNNIVPQAALGGGTPVEIYKGSWNEATKLDLLKEKAVALQQRREENLRPSCAACPEREPISSDLRSIFF